MRSRVAASIAVVTLMLALCACSRGGPTHDAADGRDAARVPRRDAVSAKFWAAPNPRPRVDQPGKL